MGDSKPRFTVARVTHRETGISDNMRSWLKYIFGNKNNRPQLPDAKYGYQWRNERLKKLVVKKPTIPDRPGEKESAASVPIAI